MRSMLLIVLAYLGFISLGLPDGLLGVAWPSIRAEFGLPLDALGALLVTFTAGYLVSSFSSGRLLRLVNVGTLLAVSTAATAASLIGYSLSPAWWLLVALGTMAGAGAGAIDAGLNTFVATHFSTRTLNWLHASFGVGTTIGPLLMAGILGAGLAWRWGYLAVGVAEVALAAAFFATRRRWIAPAPAHGAPAPARGAGTIDTLRLPMAWLGIAIFLVYTGIEIGVGQWAFSVLTLSRGVPETTASLWVSLYWGGLTAGRIVFGVIADRAPVDRLLRGSLVLLLGGGLLAWFGGGGAVAAVGLLLTGLALAPVFPSLISTTPARVGSSHAGNAIGFQIAAAALGGAALPALFGIMAQRAGLETFGPALFAATLVLIALFELTVARTRAQAAMGRP